MNFKFNFTDFKCIIEDFSKPSTFLSTISVADRMVLAEVPCFSRREVVQSRFTPFQCKD